MNQQTNTAPRAARPAPSNRHPLSGRKKPSTATLRIMRGAMLVVGGMILVIGLLLLILPMLRVQRIKVEGNTYYTAEEIIAASGIAVGEQEMLTLDTDAAMTSIYLWDTAKHIDNIEVKRYFTTVKIIVTEPKTVMYTEFNGKYYSIDLGKDFRVLRECGNEAELAEFPRVELPLIASLSVGGKLTFEDENADFSYITTLLETLEKRGVLENLTALDVSSKFNVSYETGENCLVELGKVERMDTKLGLVNEILCRRVASGTGYSVVNVTDTQKPTYRLLDSADVLLAE